MNIETITGRTEAQRETGTTPQPRILTTHSKNYRPLWRERTVLLPGWQEEWERLSRKPEKNTYWRAMYWACRLFLASRRFDVVVTGSERMALAFALLQRLARLKRVPHVMIMCMWNLPEGGFRQVFKRWELRLVIDAVSRIVLFNRRQIGVYAREFAVPAEKFAWVPYHSTLYDAEYAVSEGDYVFAGGDSCRDYATLLEAARGLPYRVVIAALCRDRFHGLDIPKNVEILGASQEQFFSLMAGAGVVALPLHAGLLHSGGHQTYLNAMLMGKPVVVADDCGTEEYIVHGVTGMLVRPGDTVALRDAIRTLMENPRIARSLGERAKTAAAAYSPERFFERVFALVDESVSGGDNA